LRLRKENFLMGVSPMNSTDSTQSLNNTLMARLHAAKISKKTAHKSTATTSASKKSTSFSSQLLKAFKATNTSKTNPLDALVSHPISSSTTNSLDSLVSNGTITKDQETAIISASKSAFQAKSSTNGISNTTNTTNTTSTPRANSLSRLVIRGVITQKQADAIDTAFIAENKSKSRDKTDPLDSLVSAGTITQKQSNIIMDAMNSQANIPVTNASLLSSGTITQAQEDTFATARKAYGN